MNEENHMGWKLVSGVRRDVVNLFKLFANTNSVRFEEFCKVWKEVNFSLIFSNRNSFTELLEFSEELLQIVKEYLFSVYEFHTRAAAMYALYGLYFKQPIIGAAKIRFTKTEWEEVFSLIEQCKVEQHYDIAFIFTKLYAGMERGFRKYSEKRSSLHSKVCDVELLYRPLINEKLVNSLVKLESLYCRKKSELLGKKNLVFIDGKFAESLQDELKNYKSALECQYSTKSKTVVDTEIVHKTRSVGIRGGTEHLTLTAETPDSSRSKKKPRLGEGMDDDVSMKMKKFNKKYLEMLAKKKAEFYIQKIQSENVKKASERKATSLGLLELDVDSESENA